LRGHVNPGHYVTVDEASAQFAEFASEVVRRAAI